MRLSDEKNRRRGKNVFAKNNREKKRAGGVKNCAMLPLKKALLRGKGK